MRDSLAEPGFPAIECGVLYPLTPGCSLACREAFIVDVSDGGLSFRLDHPVEIGVNLRVDLSSCVFEGTVVYCRPDGAYFDVGIRLHGGASYSRTPRIGAYGLPI